MGASQRFGLAAAIAVTVAITITVTVVVTVSVTAAETAAAGREETAHMICLHAFYLFHAGTIQCMRWRGVQCGRNSGQDLACEGEKWICGSYGVFGRL